MTRRSGSIGLRLYHEALSRALQEVRSRVTQGLLESVAESIHRQRAKVVCLHGRLEVDSEPVVFHASPAGLVMLKESDQLLEPLIAPGELLLTMEPAVLCPSIQSSMGELCSILDQAETMRIPSPSVMLHAQEVSANTRVAMTEFFKDTPLPNGWTFDGSRYVSFDGQRSRERPDIDDLIEQWHLHDAKRCEELQKIEGFLLD